MYEIFSPVVDRPHWPMHDMKFGALSASKLFRLVSDWPVGFEGREEGLSTPKVPSLILYLKMSVMKHDVFLWSIGPYFINYINIECTII